MPSERFLPYVTPELNAIYERALTISPRFKHKRLLFIGSESYDAPVVTVIQGLQDLGFEVFTIGKPNMNSWFCNHVVDSPDGIHFDFVLSNSAWGTRWSDYDRFNLRRFPMVLIDGDDNPMGLVSWREKHSLNRSRYPVADAAEMDAIIPQWRWMDSAIPPDPAVVFCSQRHPDDDESVFLPFGIQREHLGFSRSIPFEERSLDFVCFLGSGRARKLMHWFLKIGGGMGVFPGKLAVEATHGPYFVPALLRHSHKMDPDLFRCWAFDETYFDRLNHAKALVYPGVAGLPFWDSRRPWEALANGCLVLYGPPTIALGDYSLAGLSPFLQYNHLLDLTQKAWFLTRHPEAFKTLQTETIQAAKKYFSPKAIARYFLMEVDRKG